MHTSPVNGCRDAAAFNRTARPQTPPQYVKDVLYLATEAAPDMSKLCASLKCADMTKPAQQDLQVSMISPL